MRERGAHVAPRRGRQMLAETAAVLRDDREIVPTRRAPQFCPSGRIT